MSHVFCLFVLVNYVFDVGVLLSWPAVGVVKFAHRPLSSISVGILGRSVE